jgi:hypothetical protein
LDGLDVVNIVVVRTVDEYTTLPEEQGGWSQEKLSTL